jgi:dihydrofolate synthase/folylpolyglutamate synthase
MYNCRVKIVDYKGVKEYLESFIRPVLFQKVTLQSGEETDPLDRFRILLNLLANPEQKFRSISISGTSGKGSTSYLISRILHEAGYNVGLSISPHLERINERIQINNKEIEEKELVKLVHAMLPVVEKMKHLPCGEPSYFELLLGMAFLYFAEKKVDIAVVEVGIEGRYDATNVLTPLVSVLTNISLDHMNILGNTIEAIAREAVSVVRKNTPLITGVRQNSIKKIVEKRASELDAPIHWLDPTMIKNASSDREGSLFDLERSSGVLKNIRLSLAGDYQIRNALTAIETVEALNKKSFTITQDAIKRALSHASFPGRFEMMKKNVPVLLDGAHNPAKMEAFIISLEALYKDEKKIFLIAIKKTKDVHALLSRITGIADGIVITQFQHTTDLALSAATPVVEIKEELRKAGFRGNTWSFSDSSEALQKAVLLAEKENGMVVVTGSLYLVGEIRSILAEGEEKRTTVPAVSVRTDF